MHLTPHFSVSELTRTGTGLPNEPTEVELARLLRLAQLLERIRTRWGPLTVTSGFRSEAVNRAVGGVARSAHRTGDAADVVPTLARVEDVWCWLPESGLSWDQAIWERRGSSEWLHIGLPPPWLVGPPRMHHLTDWR